MSSYLRTLIFIVSAGVLHGMAGAEEHDPYAFEQDWRWVHFTTESGLPSDFIYGMAEASDGTVWVSTAAGIAWYDNYVWHPVDTSVVPVGLRGNHIHADSDGRILVVSGYALFKGNREGFHQPSSRMFSDAFPFGQDSILVVKFGGLGGKLYLFAHEEFEKLLPDETILNVWQTAGGGVWVNTLQSLYRWNGSEWDKKLSSNVAQLKVIPTTLVENKSGQGFASVALPYKMWGLWRWKRDEVPVREKSELGVSVKCAAIDSGGRILVVDESGSIRLWDRGRWARVEFDQSGIRDIEFLRFRSNGDLWVGTQRGLFLFRHSSTRWAYFRNELPDPRNSINEILKARDGSLWLATSGGIVVRRPDGITENIDRIHDQPLYVVTGLIQDRKGDIWISSGGYFDGAYRWDGSVWHRVCEGTPLDSNKIHKIRMDRRGRLWFLAIWPKKPVLDSTATLGAFVFDDGKFVEHWAVEGGLPGNATYAFTETNDGAYWFGTSGGVGRWRDGVWKYWRTNQELSGWWEPIFTLCVDSSQNVWFGNRIRGIGRIDKNDSLSLFTTADGLVNNEVWDICADDSDGVWVATSGGLSRFRNDTWVSIDSRSGLLSSELWPLMRNGNTLYVGSRGAGLSILDLSASDLHSPRLRIERTATEGNSAVLQWKTFAFWGDPSPGNILTRFRLNNGPWSIWGNHHDATIDSLQPGSYTVHVQAIGPFGNLDPEGQTASFRIVAPLYLHPMVLIPTGAMLLIAVLSGVTLYDRKKKYNAGLRESEEKFRSISENTSSAIFIHENFRILFVNPAAQNLTGYQEEELTRKSILDLIDPVSRDLFMEMHLNGSGTHRGTRRAELKLRKKSGEACWVDLTEGRILFKGTPSIVVTASDITERKVAEEKILANQQQLRTLATELSMTEDRERRRIATALHDSVGQALAFCKIKLGVLQNEISSPDLLDQLREVRSYIETSIKHTRSLTFELCPPTLHELGLRSSLEWLAEQMESQHSLHISIEGEKRLMPLNAEMRSFLFHAVRELLLNVVKHARAGQAVVCLRDAGTEIHIAVSDDGIGQNLESSNDVRPELQGFGLFSIRERIIQMGGGMAISSAEGKGTCIELHLPYQMEHGENGNH